MAVEDDRQGDALFVASGAGMRRADVVDAPTSLDQIRIEMEAARRVRYDALDTYLGGEVTVAEGEAFDAFFHVATTLREQGEVDRLQADMARDRIDGRDLDPAKVTHLADASERLDDFHTMATLARNKYSSEGAGKKSPEDGQIKPGDTFKGVEAGLRQVHIPDLIGAEATIIRLKFADPTRPLQWQQVGPADEREVRRRPNEPTHAQIEAMATQTVAAELGMRRKRMEIAKFVPGATPAAAPTPRRIA